MKPHVRLIGPTASGKTHFSLAWKAGQRPLDGEFASIAEVDITPSRQMDRCYSQARPEVKLKVEPGDSVLPIFVAPSLDELCRRYVGRFGDRPWPRLAMYRDRVFMADYYRQTWRLVEKSGCAIKPYFAWVEPGRLVVVETANGLVAYL